LKDCIIVQRAGTVHKMRSLSASVQFKSLAVMDFFFLISLKAF